MIALANQIAVVTGASSGIGKAIALELAAQSAALCLVGRNSEALEAVATSARQNSPLVRCYRADLSLVEDVRKLTTSLQDDFECIDLLIHSAGTMSLGPIAATPAENFDSQYYINVRAPYVLTQALLPLLKSRGGQIVFINSSVGLRARANVGQYAATKHALKALADTLRDEVNADGVRVLSVFLGRTDTPMQMAVHGMEKRPYRAERLMRPEDVAATVVHALGLPRTAEVTDISMRPFRKLDRI